MTDALVVLGGYLLGSMPFGFWLVRLFKGADIRTQGSGNIGATNVWRVYGKTMGIPIVLLDVAKGFVPGLTGVLVTGDWLGVLAGAAAMLGHYRPLYLGFQKGGKTVATAGGVAFAVAPLAAAACLAVWILAFLGTRYASVASIATALALPVACALTGESWPVIAFGAGACAAVIFLHRVNIRRLRAGTESRFERRARSSLM